MAKRPTTGGAQSLSRRQMSRAKREARLQRWIVIGTVVLAVAAVGVIGYGLLDQDYLRPNKPVITVGDMKVTGGDFENQVKTDVYLELGGQVPLSTYGLDAQSYSKIILDTMTNDLVVAQKAKEKGVTVTDADVLREVQTVYFGYDAGTPVATGTPTETLVPTSTGSPTVTSTYVLTITPSPTLTPIPNMTATPSPTVAPTGTDTPTPSGPATATPSPAPTVTPLDQAGYDKDFQDFLERAASATGLTTEQVKTAWFTRIKSGLLRDKLMAALGIKADKQKTEIHAAHILLKTEDDAKKALDRIKKGESFEKVAAEVSTDTTNAYKGGDLGWFGPGAMDKDFEAAALKVPVGQISDPIKTQFGWHLIKVYDSKVEPATGAEQQQQIQDQFSAMIDQWKTDYKVDTTDTTWQQFVPDIQ